MQSDVASGEYGSTHHRVRTGFFVDVGILEDEESGDLPFPRRLSNGGADSWDTKKRNALARDRKHYHNAPHQNHNGPPMIIREESGMSMVSDFTNDMSFAPSDPRNVPKQFEESAEFDRMEAEKRMTQIRECGSFATVGMSLDGKEASCNVKNNEDGVQSICLDSLADKKKPAISKKIENPPSDDYIRQLEVELISLKMKMAHAQSQIDEHKMLANREQMTLREFQEKLEQEKLFLQHENTRLKSELEEERENVKKLKSKLKEQDVVIKHLKQNAQRTSKEKSKLLRENTLLHQSGSHNDFTSGESIRASNQEAIPVNGSNEKKGRSQRFNNFISDKLNRSASKLIS